MSHPSDRPAVAGERETRLAGLAEIPAAGSEERAFWIEAAEQHGFEPVDDADYTQGEDDRHIATEQAILKLMSEARKQGHRDAIAQPTAPGAGGGEAERILSEACEPWSFSTGAPPDYESPLTGVFCAGMAYSESLLAKLLRVDRFEGGDGSEDFDCDATQTLCNILTGAGMYDPEDGRWAALANRPAQAEAGTAGAEIRTRPDRAALRALIRKHGGEFFGPRVEHVSMEEQAFWRFLDEVMDLAAPQPEPPAAGRSEGGYEEKTFRSQGEEWTTLVPRSAAPVTRSPDAGGLEELRRLSEAATQGEWSLGDRRDGYVWLDAAGGSERVAFGPKVPWGSFASFIVEMKDGPTEIGEANAALIVALVNAFRAGKLGPLSASPPAAEPGLDREAVARIIKEHLCFDTQGVPHGQIRHRQNVRAWEAARAILALATRAAGTGGDIPWRDMRTAPAGEPIVAKHRPTPRMPHGWVATIRLGHGDDERLGMYDTILHYNGDDLLHRFHGMWEGWLPVDALSVRSAEPATPDPARSGSGAAVDDEWEPIDTCPERKTEDHYVWVFGGDYEEPTRVPPEGRAWRNQRAHFPSLKPPTLWRKEIVPVAPALAPIQSDPQGGDAGEGAR